MDDKKRPDKWLCPICGQVDFREYYAIDDICPVCGWWFDEYDTWKKFTYRGEEKEWIRQKRVEYNYYDNLKKQGVEYIATDYTAK